MTDEELQRVVRAAVAEAVSQTVEATVTETLIKLGVDARDPIEVQKDFQHLREWRTATDALKRRGMMALMGILVAGACGAFWIGLKALVANH